MVNFKSQSSTDYNLGSRINIYTVIIGYINILVGY